MFQIEGSAVSSNSVQYHFGGRPVSMIMAAGTRISASYDKLSRVTAVVKGGSVTNRYEYDTRDNVVAVIDGNGHKILLGYNRNNLLVKRQYQDGSFTAYKYDPCGRLSETIDAEGHMTRLHYSVDGLVILKKLHSPTNYVDLAVTNFFDVVRTADLGS